VKGKNVEKARTECPVAQRSAPGRKKGERGAKKQTTQIKPEKNQLNQNQETKSYRQLLNKIENMALPGESQEYDSLKHTF